ncbi:Na(+)/H(+) exchange regulatory cofactor NHE-RF1 [Nothoprocta perdicaria]|uniref:Na(+)/H(+) exchange regulatory cofactor NHE-RF1 n=1 Tax=Nothoprocta perdicaria TaxID=30464 RepID=UPI000E1B59EA|nr:Na(+)/H(+) exchange regulatory cofactor NHE-RF1 [Nothoprocta perdicaria]
MSSAAPPAPRLCCLERSPTGYGFHLHGEKGKAGQYIRLVEAGSPAERAGLRAGDRLLEVDGDNVEAESHQRVVERIRAAAGAVRLLVVETLPGEPRPGAGGADTAAAPGGDTAATPGGDTAEAAAEPPRREPSPAAERKELRPRLCCMKKGPNGYGFNLHSDKSRPGQYVRAVDPDSPAEAAGLSPQDRIVEVNGVCMEGKQHADVVAAIKASGDETKLLVVDVLTDEFFKKCKVVPSEAHLEGPLPEPVANGDVGKENSAGPRPSSMIESPASPGPLAASPTLSESHGEPSEGEKRNSAPGSLLDLDIPLAVAKERAHQKRTSKRAPQMDWSKKNELFSNL